MIEVDYDESGVVLLRYDGKTEVLFPREAEELSHEVLEPLRGELLGAVSEARKCS